MCAIIIICTVLAYTTCLVVLQPYKVKWIFFCRSTTTKFHVTNNNHSCTRILNISSLNIRQVVNSYISREKTWYDDDQEEHEINVQKTVIRVISCLMSFRWTSRNINIMNTKYASIMLPSHKFNLFFFLFFP